MSARGCPHIVLRIGELDHAHVQVHLIVAVEAQEEARTKVVVGLRHVEAVVGFGVCAQSDGTVQLLRVDGKGDAQCRQ